MRGPRSTVRRPVWSEGGERAPGPVSSHLVQARLEEGAVDGGPREASEELLTDAVGFPISGELRVTDDILNGLDHLTQPAGQATATQRRGPGDVGGLDPQGRKGPGLLGRGELEAGGVEA
jgi:hypothetical protein